MNTPHPHGEGVYQTSPTRAFIGLAFGALLGALIVTGSYLFGLWHVHGMDHFKQYWFSKGFGIFKIALMFWGSGLVLLAAFPWWLLHRWHYRGWRSAAALGFGLTFGLHAVLTGYSSWSMDNYSFWDSGGATVLDGVRNPYGWKVLFLDTLRLSAVSALIGVVIWRIAYRRRSS